MDNPEKQGDIEHKTQNESKQRKKSRHRKLTELSHANPTKNGEGDMWYL